MLEQNQMSEKQLGMSAEWNELINMAVVANVLFEGDLEKYFLNNICNDAEKAMRVYDSLSALTDDTGIILYDYRMLSDFADFYDFEALKTRLEAQTAPYAPNPADVEAYGRFDPSQQKRINELIVRSFDKSAASVFQPPSWDMVPVGGKSKSKRYTKRRKYKSKASTKKKRRGSKKRAGAKSNKNKK